MMLSLLVLALPLSAFAESFTVTTNKDIYTLDEKAIIVGAIPQGAPDGHAVLIKVTGPSGDCFSQHLLPASDNSFISRSIRLDGCGFGEFIVSASYADEKATSTFIISNSSRADTGSKIELRMLKNVISQAQDAVNARVRELIENGYVLPEEIAQKYSEGVSEASLALQAIEFGDAAEAKKHMILALRDFREVLNALSEEEVTRFEQAASNYDNSDVIGTYDLLQKYYNRLKELAEKNHVSKENEFEAASSLLSKTKRMIDEGNFEGAAANLGRVSVLLEEIRAEFVDGGEESAEKFATYANNTKPENEESARKLVEVADKFEKTALRLLNQTGSTQAQAKLQEALSLIASGRVSIDAQDLDSARKALSDAYYAINEARNMIDNDASNSENSGKDDDNDESNKGSNSDSDDQ
jgi:hypothetical protein